MKNYKKYKQKHGEKMKKIAKHETIKVCLEMKDSYETLKTETVLYGH